MHRFRVNCQALVKTTEAESQVLYSAQSGRPNRIYGAEKEIRPVWQRAISSGNSSPRLGPSTRTLPIVSRIRRPALPRGTLRTQNSTRPFPKRPA